MFDQQETPRMRTISRYFSVLLMLCLVTACASVSQDDQIIQSKNDKRHYRYLTLANGLPVLLINDPDAQFSAASLDVFVGSGMDPDDRAGLAHFLEHMLFLGTKKYPNPGEYQAFIKANGGQHNAYTSMEHTNYFFDVKAGAFEPALDRFAQFFIDPLLSKDYVEREKNAVNSEYQAKIKDEGRRKLDVLRQIVNQKHPFHKFSVGSLETLSSDERPIRADLLAFYQKYYSAKNMRLVVYGEQSLEQLQAWIERDFSEVPSFSVPNNHISDPLFNKGELPKWVNVKPEKQIRELSLLFPMPDYQEDYHSKPTLALGHILGHEGAGSLYAYLKKNNWIESLSAGGGLSYQGGSVFSINVELTAEGLQHQQDIVVAVFQAIHRLQKDGIPKWVFDELAEISELNFDYQEEGNPLHYVVGLSNAMQYFPAKDVLQAEYVMDDYQPKLIEQALDHLAVDNVLITVVADGFTSVDYSPYYQTPYTVANLPASLLTAIDDASVNQQIVLPAPNPLLPNNMDLIAPVAKSGAEPLLPHEIERSERMSLWYKPLDQFHTPRSSNYYSFQKSGLNKTAKDTIAMELYVGLVNDSLTDWVYPAYLAGLSFDFYAHARGMSLKVDGFSDRQSDLLAEIAEKIHQATFTDSQFERLRAEALRKVRNAKLAPPYRKALGQWQQVMRSQLWSYAETEKALESITLKDIQEFSNGFWPGAYQLSFSNGNLTKEQARANAEALQAALQRDGSFDASPSIGIRKLPKERSFEAVDSPYKDAGYLLYWQADGISVDDQANWLLLAKTLEAAYFNSLRTEQQLGYVVFANYYPMLTMPGITFVVQSPVADVAEIHKATLAFLQRAAGAVDALPEGLFAQYRSAIVKQLNEQPKNLEDESARYWNDLALGLTDFDRRKAIAEAVGAISLADWQVFARHQYQSFPDHTLLLGTTAREIIEKAFGSFLPLPHKSSNSADFVEYPAILRSNTQGRSD
ncbi:Protease 3 [BD1-7 clade bacterium]|uniref:Protease 3 n=1 Tax=BD1-7 clade bacterium TaxID=2029982 RepID=A0A5S9MY40_9GAMM|nr:Protease 3 [BD1-7 clade bacterium]